MRRVLPLLLLPALACQGESSIATNGYEERLIDDELRHGQGLRVVDIDGDGNLDVIAAISLTDAVHLYLRKQPLDPEGRQWDRISISGSDTIVAMDADVADIDGDGDLDIAAIGLFERRRDDGAALAEGFVRQGQVTWYENPGDPRGVWTTHQVAKSRLSDDGTAYVGGLFGGRTLRLADLDADGDADIVVGAIESAAARFEYQGEQCVQEEALGNGVHWFANRGAADPGKFDGPEPIDATLNQVGLVRVADVDADNRLDVVATSAGLTGLVWYRNVAGGDGAPTFVRYVLATNGGAYHGLEVANLDADAPLEFITGTSRAYGGAVHLHDPPAALAGNPGALWTTSTVTLGIGALACQSEETCGEVANTCVTDRVGCMNDPAITINRDVRVATACDAVEACDNGVDDDENGATDCEDPTCEGNPLCQICETRQRCGNEVLTTTITVGNPGTCTEETVDADCDVLFNPCTEGYCPAVVANPVVQLGDFNGNGVADDIFVAEATGRLMRFYRQGDGSWERRDIRKPDELDGVAVAGTGYIGITGIGAGDIDGDGRLDVITSTYEIGTRDRISWWKNLGE